MPKKKRQNKFYGGDLSASVTRAQKAAADARAIPAADKQGRGTIGKSYTDMFGRTIGSKDRKQVNLQDTTQVANEDGTLTRTYYDYDGNVIQSKTTESAGASQAAAKRAGYTGDPVVAGEEYREVQKNKSLFAAASDKGTGNGTAVGELPPPVSPGAGKRPRTRLTAAQKDALRSSVFAKSGGKVKKKAGGKVKKKAGGKIKKKAGGAVKKRAGGTVGKAYTSQQNKKYGGGVYPKVGNTGD